MRTCICLLIAAMVCSSVAFAQTDKPAMASITGRITYKNQPLADLTVTLESSNSGSRSSRPIVVQTDSDGRYRLTGIAAGQYVVVPRALAYAVPLDGATWYPGKRITISDGEAVENFDFALVKGGVITGTITDHAGRAVIGQRVHLNRLDEKNKASDFQTGYMWMYNTDDRGAYRLFGLPAGRYKVSVGEGQDSSIISIGRAGGFYRLTYYPSVNTEAEAKIIELSESGEVTDIDIKLDKPVRTYDAKGRIVDGNTGAPLAGLRCSYGQLLQGQMRVISTSGEDTNSNGEFVLRSLRPGPYAAFVYSENTPEYYSDQITFEITSQNVEGLEIKAYRGASINGQVVIEGTNDPAHRQLLRRVGVNARAEGQTVLGGIRSAEINADGTFRITGLRPGKNRLSTYVPDNLPLVHIRTERDGVLLGDELHLTAAEQVSGVKVAFAYGAGVLRGQVNIAGGTLPPDTRLVVEAKYQGRSAGRSATVDTRGRFVIEGLTAGEYALSLLQIITTGVVTRAQSSVFLQNVTVSTGETAVTLTFDLNAKKEGRQ